MNREQRTLLWIVILGGLAVVGSYIWGVLSMPGGSAGLWGGVPAWLLPVYQVNMLLAALGFFPFTLLFLRLEERQAGLPGRLGYRALHWLYGLLLLSSALWLPLTTRMLAAPSAGLWAAIRGSLFITGLCALGLLSNLLGLKPRPRGVLFQMALAGCIFFCLQTAVLDALVWAENFLLK